MDGVLLEINEYTICNYCWEGGVQVRNVTLHTSTTPPIQHFSSEQFRNQQRHIKKIIYASGTLRYIKNTIPSGLKHPVADFIDP